MPFDDSKHHAKGPLDVVYVNMCRLIHASIFDLRYFLLFVDEYSRKVRVYFLNTKDQTFSYLKELKALMEK